jgi:alcohol dehydrogenase
VVLNPAFRNPVAVYQGGPAVGTLAQLVRGRRFMLVTTQGWVRRGMLSQVTAACGAPVVTIDAIAENPTLQMLAALDPALEPFRGSDVAVVAIGGGSVLDSAKAIAAALASGLDMRAVCELARADAPLPPTAVPAPLFCVPTTAGTGSEVTRTATLWDAGGSKYALADDRLYPQAAILDPAMTQTLPDAITLSSGIDALSHAMESIWNVHHNPISDALARDAIARIWTFLPAALAGPDLPARAQLQTAAMLAGMAISATRTALAHSMSYPLTGRFGLRHGLACGFTLPQVAAFTLERHPDRAALIAEAMGLADPARIPAALHEWMDRLGVYRAVNEVIDAAAVAGLGAALLAPGRAGNNLRQATPDEAQAILLASLSGGAPSVRPVPPKPGRVFWITGLSGAGKSTLSRAVADALRASGRPVVLFDGDELRAIIGGSLAYREADRRELTARYSGLSHALAQQGIDVVCATIGLFHASQQWNRAHIPHYVEVFLKVDLQTLIARDSKGLYARALSGETSDVVGIDIPYEEPQAPDLVIDTTERREDFSGLAAQVLAAGT